MESRDLLMAKLYETVGKCGLVPAVRVAFGNQARFKLGFSKNVCDILIEEISLSVRGYNVLKRSNLHTIGDVIDAINDKKLSGLRNLGEKTAREIKTKVVNYGYDALSERGKKEFLSDIVDMNLWGGKYGLE